MLFILGLFFIGLVGGSLASDYPICPFPDGVNATLLPHETNCSQFYKCSNGVAYLYNCSDGLHFNPTLNVCDWPYAAGCEAQPAPETTPSAPVTPAATTPSAPVTPAATTPTTTTAAAVDPRCPFPDGVNATLLPHETNCSQFYKCSNGVAYLYNCSAGLHFNPTLKVCDWPYAAGCEVQPTSETTSSSPATPPATTPTTKPTEPITEATAASPTAPETTPSSPASPPATTPTTKPTDPITEATAASPTAPETTPSSPTTPPATTPTTKPTEPITEATAATPTTPSGDDLDCEEVCEATFHPHPSDCSKYYICANGTAQVHQCAPGLHFNEETQECDFPENAKCDLVPACPDDCEPIFNAHPKNCDQYYYCSNGISQLRNCTAGLHFNAKTGNCDFPENAQCEAPVTTPSSTPAVPPTTTPEASGGPNCPFPDGEFVTFFPHETNCSQFYKCSNGYPYLYDCPAGLHFNTTLNVCDWPQDAGCS